MEQLIIAVLDRIKSELDRCYWNKNQKEMSSPFENTGETYSNKFFTVKAYNWEDNTEPNFESEFLSCWWYKHSRRGLEYKLTFDTSEGAPDHLEQLSSFLYRCLKEIKTDFEEKSDASKEEMNAVIKNLKKTVRVNERYKGFTLLDAPASFKDLQIGNDIKVVQLHSIEPCGVGEIAGFCGVFSWKNNVLESLDGDCYSEETLVYGYNWFEDEEGCKCLDILVYEW